MPDAVFYDILQELIRDLDGIWFCYDHVEDDYYRNGYTMPFPLSRAEFGKELANHAYHRRGFVWLETKRVTNNFGRRIRWHRIRPLVW